MTVTFAATPLATRRALVLAKTESSFGTDPTPTVTENALLVSEPNFTIEPNVLERTFVRASLSPGGTTIGRKLANLSFSVELRSNGSTNDGTSASRIGTLLKACGFEEITGDTAAERATAVRPDGGNTGPAVAWSSVGGTATSDGQPVTYEIEVTTGGASATAEVSITPDPDAVDNTLDAAQTGVTVTSASALDLTTAGSEWAATPTWTGDLVLGDKWRVTFFPQSVIYKPRSDSFESCTFYFYVDGVRHVMTGCFGTFTLNANAGEFGTLEFSFTGQYAAPTDVSFPTGIIYEETVPPIIELAKLRLFDFTNDEPAIVGALSIDMANEIIPRPSVSHSDGYFGTRISSRAPTGSLDPEMSSVSDYPWFETFAGSTKTHLQFRAGQTDGNIVWFWMPSLQFTGMSYQDRDGIRALEAGFSLAADQGDDELYIAFA